MENPIISQKITMFIKMLQGFVEICQKKLDILALEVPDEYQCGKRSFEQGEISLDEISKHTTDDYILVFHLFQTKEMIEEMIASLQSPSKKSVFPAVWWDYALGYWYGTREHLATTIYRNHPDAFVSIYPIEHMHDMVQKTLQKRLTDVEANPAGLYVFDIDLRRLFAGYIWWLCYKHYMHKVECNAVYYYLDEDLYYSEE